MSRPIRVPVPATVDAVFSDDGRVFYSLDALIEEFEPRVAARESVVHLFNDPESEGYVAGERAVIESIRQSREILSLDSTFDS